MFDIRWDSCDLSVIIYQRADQQISRSHWILSGDVSMLAQSDQLKVINSRQTLYTVDQSKVISLITSFTHKINHLRTGELLITPLKPRTAIAGCKFVNSDI